MTYCVVVLLQEKIMGLEQQIQSLEENETEGSADQISMVSANEHYDTLLTGS
jgi:hypothetical protein